MAHKHERARPLPSPRPMEREWPRGADDGSVRGLGLTLIATPLLALIPLLWFDLLTRSLLRWFGLRAALLFPLGLIMGAVLRKYLIPRHGPRSLLLGCGFVVLLCIPLFLIHGAFEARTVAIQTPWDRIFSQVGTYAVVSGALQWGTTLSLPRRHKEKGR